MLPVANGGPSVVGNWSGSTTSTVSEGTGFESNFAHGLSQKGHSLG